MHVHPEKPSFKNDFMSSEFLGRVKYVTGQKWIDDHWQKVAENPTFQVMGGMEFDPVVTVGKRGKNHVTHGIESYAVSTPIPEFVETDRGGEAVLHLPGQLVVYPLVNLRYFGVGIREWTAFLLEVCQRLLQQHGMTTELRIRPREKSVGLYSKKGKVAFIGLRIRQGVSTHGVAINIQNDLSLFQNFTCCGVKNQKVDRLGGDKNLSQLFYEWLEIYKTLWLKNFHSRRSRTNTSPSESLSLHDLRGR